MVKDIKKKQEEAGICKPRLSVFYSKLGDYLCTIREISFFSTKKHKHYQICELKKTALNN